jgi:hypothetical protein
MSLSIQKLMDLLFILFRTCSTGYSEGPIQGRVSSGVFGSRSAKTIQSMDVQSRSLLNHLLEPGESQYFAFSCPLFTPLLQSLFKCRNKARGNCVF